MVATYGGDSNYSSSSSTAQNQTVNKKTVTPTVSTSPGTTSVWGQTVTITGGLAIAASGCDVATGTIDFYDSATYVGNGTLSPFGSGSSASITSNTLALGSHSFYADYSGDSNYNAANSSSPASLTVDQASTNTSVSSSVNPSTYNQSVTFTATVTAASPGSGTPTGTVTFKCNGTTMGTGSLSGGVATYTTSAVPLGSNTISAVYGGDTNFITSTGGMTQTVILSTSSVVASSLNPSELNNSVTFTATITPQSYSPQPSMGGFATFYDGLTSLGTGSVTWNSGTNTGTATLNVSNLTINSHSITIVYNGDTNYQTSTAPVLPQAVHTIATTTAVTTSGTPSNYGSSVTLTATVTPNTTTTYPSMGGSVTFFDTNNVELGSGNISWNSGTHVGTATLATSILLGGTQSITGRYSGDPSYAPSGSSGLTQVVDTVTATLTASSSASTSVNGQPVTLQVTGTGVGVPPSGTVTISQGMTVLGTPSFTLISSNSSIAKITLSSLAVGGPYTISFNSAGDNNYSSSSTTLSQTVNQANSSTALTSSANPSNLCQNVTFTATVSAVSPGSGTPTGTVTFTINGTPGSPVTLSGGVATTSTSALSTGSNSVSAAYSGDSNFNTSSSPTLTQTVNGAVSWILNAAPLNSDPIQGQKVPVGSAVVVLQTGQLQRPAANADSSIAGVCPCPCDCKNDNYKFGSKQIKLTYLSSVLNGQPIILATLASDFCSSVPSQIQAQLTFNGTAQPTVTFNPTGHNPGDVYAIPLQVSSPVTTSGVYAWSVEVWTTVGTTVYDSTVSGEVPVYSGLDSPFGAGWGLGGTSGLVLGSAGMFDFGDGDYRYFSGTPTTLPYTFTSPANDQGTMVQNADSSYTYTDKYQNKTNFNSGGTKSSARSIRMG